MAGYGDERTSTEYGFLYPNSVVVMPNGELFVGMRHFVTRIIPRGLTFREYWLVPKNCSRFRNRISYCTCES